MENLSESSSTNSKNNLYELFISALYTFPLIPNATIHWSQHAILITLSPSGRNEDSISLFVDLIII